VTFEDITGYGFLVGIVLIVLGTLLLALFPRWGGFRVQGVEEEKQGALETIVKAIADAFTKFVSVVADMASSERRYHPGQYCIAIGFLLALLCGLLWIVATIF